VNQLLARHREWFRKMIDPRLDRAIRRRVDASDVFALGAIFYHMLTGRPPFQASSPFDTMLMVPEQDPVPARLLNPTVDRDLEMIALKCLHKPVELRCASAAALADDLAVFLRGDPVSATRDPPDRRGEPMARRDAPRGGARELAPPLDVAQPRGPDPLPFDERHTVAGRRLAETLLDALGRGTGHLVRRLLGPAAAERAHHLCRAADRARVGGERHLVHAFVCCRDAARASRPDPVARLGPLQQDGVLEQGRSPLGASPVASCRMEAPLALGYY
jgi:hypothetical protein